MIRLLRNLRAVEWVLVGAASGLIVFQVWLDLRMPEYMEKITTLVQTEGSSIGQIWSNGGLMMACAAGSLLSAIAVGFIAAWVGAAFSRRLRTEMFNKVDGFSMEEINRFSTASLITRTTNDIVQVQGVVVFGLQILFKAPIMAIWAIIKIAGRGTEWTVATGIAVAVMLVAFIILAAIVLPKFRQMQILTDNLTKVARENLTGLPVVHAYNAKAFQEAKFDTANERLTRTHRFTGVGFAFLNPIITLVISSMSLAIFWIGAYLINRTADPFQKLTYFSNMMVFMSYAMQVIMSFMMITMMFIMLPRASVSARRVNEVLRTKSSVVGGAVTDGGAEAGAVSFKNVSFKYPGAANPVIEDITFDVRPGETVAIIGGTGSGKSTLINLVPRFFDATAGEILVDGVDVRQYELEALRAKIGYVTQKAILFSGSVADNVAFGAEQPDDARVREAVKIAQATAFVEKMDGAYGADISRGGTNISGGQKQRISIARAIYKRPEIFIFDDSFSALDYKTDSQLRTALKKELAGATCLIVAQRIGTIMNADKIIVLEDGRVVGAGRHMDLLKKCKVYREIASSQLTEDELRGTN